MERRFSWIKFLHLEPRWIFGEPKKQEDFSKEYRGDCMHDKKGNLVCLFPNEYRLNLAVKNYPELEFSTLSL